jgi:uncharacterized protein
MITLLRIIGLAALVYVGLVCMVAVFQRRLIYLPSRASETALLREAGMVGLEPWRAADGTLIGWKTPNASAANRLLVFHGNGGYALHREQLARGFQRMNGGALWQVHLFEYPGYGARNGAPSESAISEAAESALAMLGDRAFVLGESLGSGPAARLAGRFPEKVRGVMLVTPLSRLADVAAHHYPYLPVRWMLRDRYDVVAALGKTRVPLAIHVAGGDEVIPPACAREIFDTYSGPKRLWTDPEATHNTVNFGEGEHWLRAMSDFVTGESPPGRQTSFE